MRQLAIRTICLLAILASGSETMGLYLSSRSRPAAGNDPEGPQCLASRRALFDTGETLYFTTPDPLTADEQLALDAALAAWNGAPHSSISIAYGGVAPDNDSAGDAGAPPDISCTYPDCTLGTDDVNSIKLTSGSAAFCGQDVVRSRTLIREPGQFLDWITHTFCGDKHWTIGGSRTVVETTGLSGAVLARVLAHEIGMALGFAPTDAPGNLLNPNIDMSSAPPPYTITLGTYDREAAAAVYPAWDIAGPETVCGESAGNVASIVNAQANTLYTWTPHNGAVITSCGGTFIGDSCQGTSTITFTAPAFEGYIFCFAPPCPVQSVRFTVTATRGCSGSGTTPAYNAAGEITIPVIPGDYQVSPVAANFGSSSAAGSLQVLSTKSCGYWTAVAPNGSFVTITSGGSGSGNGMVQFSVAANPGPYARSTMLSVAGEPVEITQSGGGRGTITLAATSQSSRVDLSWSAIAGASAYIVWKKSGAGEFYFLSQVNALATTDFGVSNGNGYLYRVTGYDGDEYIAHSNVDMAVPFGYTDPTIAAFSTLLRAVHLLELQAVLNTARYTLGWPGTTFGSVAVGQFPQRSHMLELRGQADTVRAGIGLPPAAYPDPGIVAGVTPVRATHVISLRDALR